MVATVLYNEMLGSVPDFNRGAVVAMFMLVPSVVSISLLHFLERFNIRYSKVSGIELRKGRIRDICCGAASVLILASVLCIFAVIFVVPMVEEWPYRRQFTTEHIKLCLRTPDCFLCIRTPFWYPFYGSHRFTGGIRSCAGHSPQPVKQPA